MIFVCDKLNDYKQLRNNFKNTDLENFLSCLLIKLRTV